MWAGRCGGNRAPRRAQLGRCTVRAASCAFMRFMPHDVHWQGPWCGQFSPFPTHLRVLPSPQAGISQRLNDRPTSTRSSLLASTPSHLSRRARRCFRMEYLRRASEHGARYCSGTAQVLPCEGRFDLVVLPSRKAEHAVGRPACSQLSAMQPCPRAAAGQTLQQRLAAWEAGTEGCRRETLTVQRRQRAQR